MIKKGIFGNPKKSFAQLSCPIVACEMGRFYRKEALIELLVDRNTLRGRFAPEIHEKCLHIRNMKDVMVIFDALPAGLHKKKTKILFVIFVVALKGIYHHEKKRFQLKYHS